MPAPITTPVAQPGAPAAPTGTANLTLQEPIPESLNTEDIPSLEQWTAEGLYDMAVPTTRSQHTIVPDSQSMPGLIRQEAHRRAEERSKKRAEELASEFESSLEEKEYEDLVSISSSSEEGEGTETTSQLDPIDEPELLPFEIQRPTTCSMLGRPTARPKCKATMKKLEGPSSSTRKKHRG